MKPPVLTKADYYRRNALGEFGNTNPSYTSLDHWLADGHAGRGYAWGIRHTSQAGSPLTKLNVPDDQVADWIRGNPFNGHYNISPMVGRWGYVLWEGDVYEDDAGRLVCSGNVNPADGSWRTHMKRPRLWEGSAAHVLLDTVLNANSRDDLRILLAEYPDHVVELSALSTEFGTVPGRNAIVWECRRY